jgi:hypothetical protein
MHKIKMQKWSPCDEQWLVQAVEHIDDDIVVGGDIHDRARELLVDCNHLKQDRNRVILHYRQALATKHMIRSEGICKKEDGVGEI